MVRKFGRDRRHSNISTGWCVGPSYRKKKWRKRRLRREKGEKSEENEESEQKEQKEEIEENGEVKTV